MSDDFLLNYGELKHWGKPELYHKTTLESAPTQCGDKINIYIVLEGDKIVDAKFDGDACILSTISADLLLESILNKKLSEVRNWDESTYLSNFPIKVSPGRVGCVLLPLRLLKKIK